MNDTQLSELSLLELQDLQAKLHIAIRKAIRAQQDAMASRYRPVAVVPERPKAMDLTCERDAWLARKRSGL
jgi:hypothetical protein